MSVFIPIPKKSHAKEFLNYRTTALLSHASEVVLKILQARFQQYMNQELPNIQAGFRKGRGTRDQIANIHWIMEKAGNSRKTFTSASLTIQKPLCGSQQTMKNSCRGWNSNLTCLLRNLYAVQEATVRTTHGTAECFKTGKGVQQGCILSP